MHKILFLIIAGSAMFNVYADARATSKTVAKTTPTLKCSNPQVKIDTTMGDIYLQLDAVKAPISVNNFIQYVESGFYKNKIFHRVIPGFMIQGGGFDKDLHQATTKASIKNEANNGLPNDKYTIAMARTNDPDSATAQFFINVNDNASLNYSTNNPGYAVFGHVIKDKGKGTEVVDKIAKAPTKTSGIYENVPKTPVIIKSAKMLPCKVN